MMKVIRVRMRTVLLFSLVWVMAIVGVGLLVKRDAPANISFESEGVHLPVVMYHHMLKESKLLGEYCITPNEFEEDLQYILAKGYTPVSAAELIAYTENGAALPEKPILITFDDGYETTYAYAYPLLRQYGVKAVVSLIGRYSDEYSNSDDHHLNYSHITWKQAKEMNDSGLVEIMNHTYNLHEYGERQGCRRMQGEDVDDYQQMLREDLQKTQQRITEAVGTAPTLFAYPFGSICEEAEEVVREMGFRITLSCASGINTITRDGDTLFNLKRYNRPHGVSSEAFFEDILE